MYLKLIIFFIINIILYQNVISKGDKGINNNYLNLLGQMKNFKKSLELINTRLSEISQRLPNENNEDSDIPEVNSVLSDRNSKPIFDIRFDSMPENCTFDEPSTCAQATKCTRLNGVYNISDINYSNKTFLAYCDYDSYGGDWLYVLKISDGTGNFNRSWQEYVNGFGNVAGEFWLGLEKLYAYTNFYGPQELNIHLENFEGRKAYARYDNFVVGNAHEKYKLKSLGRFSGTAGDSLFHTLNMEFSTYDNDNDYDCAMLREGGFWFTNCGEADPTGPYLHGNYSQEMEGSYWNSFEGLFYSPKTIIFMIRRRRSDSLN
ncbi:ficolin-1-like [Cochliomyia hominivorax]